MYVHGFKSVIDFEIDSDRFAFINSERDGCLYDNMYVLEPVRRFRTCSELSFIARYI